MPVIKSAKKALRRSIRQASVNERVRKEYKAAVKAVRGTPTPEKLKKAYSELDQAVKKNLIHRNKASRLKSRLANLLGK